MALPLPSPEKIEILRRGVVIPASPLALDGRRHFDEPRQRALYRYYAAAGAGGIAVGVHTTQFEIRDPAIGLFLPLLTMAADEIDSLARRQGRPIVRIAGICGSTRLAVREAETAAALGYDAGLLSLGALKNAAEDALIRHCEEVAHAIPLMGFYLQPAVGGRVLPFSFWRRFVEIENVVAVKIAPFNRYYTIDVARAVAAAERDRDIALYTGNDDNIIVDLLTPFHVTVNGDCRTLRIRGGLLGQFSVWTKTFVDLLEKIRPLTEKNRAVPSEWLARNAELTDANAAIFDAANAFRGCIPGINEVLRRQGLLASNHCLNPRERLSPGQAEEIDRVCADYPWLPDDAFVKEHLSQWLE